MIIPFGHSKSKITRLFFAVILIIAAGCISRKASVPAPDEIYTKVNGEESKLESNSPFYTRAMENAAKTLSFALLYRKIEVFKRDDIISLYNSSINAYHLKYKGLVKMEILSAAGYTEKVSFNEVYIIKNPVARYIFFLTPSTKKAVPFIPIVDASELR